MEWNLRTAVLATLAVLAVSAAASFGFQAATGNPLTPDLEANVSDAPEDYRINTSDRVPLVAITHTGGETVDLTTVQVIVGPQSSGLLLNASHNWSLASGVLTFRLTLNGDAIREGDAFGPGDTLRVVKVAGVVERPVRQTRVRVRVEHRPSQNVIVDRMVRIR